MPGLPPLQEGKIHSHNPSSSFPLPRNLQVQQPFSNASPGSSSSSTTTKAQNFGLHHLQTDWPGETKNGQHLDVIPGMSLFQLLSPTRQQKDKNHRPKTIVIPLFQRRYCWTPVQINRWFQDVYKATQSHATHKAMFKRHLSEGKEEQLLCLDGQQRITTTTLFLAAIRPYCRRANMTSTITQMDELLFGSDAEKILQWADKRAASILSKQPRMDLPSTTDQEDMEISSTLESFPDGWLPQSTEFQTTLIPSYIDRAAYFEILCFDPIQQALERLSTKENGEESSRIHLCFSSATKESTQYMAYSTFSQLARNLLKTEDATNFNANVLSKLFYNQLHRFSMTYLELLTENDNLQQIFLWMQEKSVFGSGRLLFNPHPGIDFTPVDLARNWIVSSVMDLPLHEQVDFYTRCRILPLEAKCKHTAQLGDILLHLVHRIDQEMDKERHVGSMEQKLLYYRSVSPATLQRTFSDDMPMMIYGRFHSHVQYRAKQLGSDPNVISRELADVIVQELVQEGENMGVLL